MEKHLNECPVGGRYLVTRVQVDEKITRRLEALGVNEEHRWMYSIKRERGA